MVDREHLDAGHDDALARLVRAGVEGLRLGDGIRLSSALVWGVHGCATITNDRPQRAVVTSAGRQRAAREYLL